MAEKEKGCDTSINNSECSDDKNNSNDTSMSINSSEDSSDDSSSINSSDSSKDSDYSTDKFLSNSNRNNINNIIIKESINSAQAACNIINILDAEDQVAQKKAEYPVWGGSRPGRAPNKDRNFHNAFLKLKKDYFSGNNSTYNEDDFAVRFRVSRNVFNRVYNKLMGIDPFIQKFDATGKKGIHPLVKLCACFRIMAYGDSFDREDENFRLSRSSLQSIFNDFCNLILTSF